MRLELRVAATEVSPDETVDVCRRAAELYENSVFTRYTTSLLVKCTGGTTIKVWGSGVEWHIKRSDHDGEMLRTDATLVFILLTEVRPKRVADVVMVLDY